MIKTTLKKKFDDFKNEEELKTKDDLQIEDDIERENIKNEDDSNCWSVNSVFKK